MYTDPTAWPLHENTMLEGAKADTTGVALPLNPVGGSRIERLSCAERPTLLGYCLDRSKAVFILTRYVAGSDCQSSGGQQVRGRDRRGPFSTIRSHIAPAALHVYLHLCISARHGSPRGEGVTAPQ